MKLVGPNGEIKITGDQCTAVIHNKFIEKQYGSIVTFPVSDLPKWLKRLKIESNEDGSIRFSNWP